MTTSEQLRLIALQEFASSGYLGTSVSRIAELAGVSKANVLYHYASKEALLEAAVQPAAEALRRIVEGLEQGRLSAANHEEFVAEYVDLLLEHRLEVHLVINQWVSLSGVAAIAVAHDLMSRLGDALKSTVEEGDGRRMRIGIALAGSAYLLAVGDEFGDHMPEDVRQPLVTVLTDLLAPVAAHAVAADLADSIHPTDPAVTAAGSAVPV